MLGRRTAKDGKLAAAKKRKWQEELDDDDSEGEAKITNADMEAWKRTLREEEKEERLQREKQEREERAKALRLKEAEEEKLRKEKDEEARAVRETAEAKKQAEDRENELRRQEALAPPGALPPDVSGIMPPGMNPHKMHLYKTTFCKRWEQGNCNFGAACHFAHGERDLRGNRPLRPLGATALAAPAAVASSPPPPPPPAQLQVGVPSVPAHVGPMRPPAGQAAATLNFISMLAAGRGAPNNHSQELQQAQWSPHANSLANTPNAPAAVAGADVAPWHQPGGSSAWHLAGEGEWRAS